MLEGHYTAQTGIDGGGQGVSGRSSGAEGISDAARKGPLLCVGDPVVATESKGAHGRRAYIISPAGELRAVRMREVRSLRQQLIDSLRSMLLPEGSSAVLGSDYWSFSIWYAVRSVFSNASAVLATRALLRAVGVGAAHAAAASATINWDGLGRIACILAVACIGNRFDNDAKTFMLLGDMLYEVGLGIEILTPLVPGLFLFTASVANAAKSISYMMRLPPRAAILKSFSKKENLGDVSAKANSQEVLSSLLGTALGIVASTMVGDGFSGAMAVYVVWCVLVAYSSYMSLRTLKLNTLNWQRAGLLLQRFVRDGRALAPREVNLMERIPSWTWPNSIGSANEPFRVRYGARLDEAAPTAVDLRRLTLMYRDEDYLLNVRGRNVHVCLSEEVGPRDALQSLLQAAYLQQQPTATLEQSYQYAVASLPKMLSALEAKGWNVHHVLFAPEITASWRLHEVDARAHRALHSTVYVQDVAPTTTDGVPTFGGAAYEGAPG
eukprot:jgi/Chlat1/2662/Chrsp179S02513